MKIEHLSWGVAMILWGFVIAVDAVTTGQPSVVNVGSTEFVGALGLMISGGIWTAGSLTGTIPLPEDGLLANRWVWYLATAGLVIATLVRASEVVHNV